MLAVGIELVTDADGTVARRAHDADVRDVDRHLLGDDASLRPGATLRGADLLVTLHLVHTFDHHLVVLWPDAHDAAALAAVLAGEYFDLIVFADVERAHARAPPVPAR